MSCIGISFKIRHEENYFSNVWNFFLKHLVEGSTRNQTTPNQNANSYATQNKMTERQKETVVPALSKDIVTFQKIFLDGAYQVTVLASVSSEN